METFKRILGLVLVALVAAIVICLVVAIKA